MHRVFSQKAEKKPEKKEEKEEKSDDSEKKSDEKKAEDDGEKKKSKKKKKTKTEGDEGSGCCVSVFCLFVGLDLHAIASIHTHLCRRRRCEKD